MKMHLCASIVALLILGICTGCRTSELASRPLTPREKMWAETLRDSYPGWKQPVQPPPFNTMTGINRTPASSPPMPPSTDTVSRFESIQAPAAPVTPYELVPADEPGPRAATTAKTHVVAKGETLSGISLQYYGTPAKWQRILEANTGVLETPRDLRPGMELRIPAL